MAVLDLPDSGWSLSRDRPDRDPPHPTQFMRLDLAQNTLDDLIQSLRDDQPARLRLGKHQTLYYGSKSQPFHASPESHPSEIYSCSSADKENLYFTGVLSHSLEVQKAKEATAATDQALATLEQSLNAFEKGKESKQTHIITDIDQVRALKAGDSRSSTGRQAALLARKPTSKVELEKDRLLKNAANRSVSSSPGLGASRSPTLPSAPTSAPLTQSKDRLRLDALKVPFVHLLAIRPVSAKFLAEQTRAPLEDCLTLARKYGTESRDNREKFDLKDKTYRDLDVWKFPYPSQDDRDQAVKNAISAFDRMRISRSDKLWQMLLPKEERGKGKCLSRLDLRTGPIKMTPTPRIQVSEDTAKDGCSTGHDTDRANGLTPRPEASRPAPKKQDASKRATKNKTNSTLTGRVTKKAERKVPPKPDGKFKSAEYVDDSDEDLEMVGEKGSKPQGANAQKSVPTPKNERLERPRPETSQTARNLAAKRPPSSTSSSPQKPSPLGSPPANGSDIHTHKRSTSGSSASPLASQIPKTKPNGISSAAQPAKPNGAVKSGVNSLKRKAETQRPSVANVQSAPPVNGSLEHKRRRAVSTSSGSTGSSSPSLGQEMLLQQLREKSQKFKQYYSKYQTLHNAMTSHPDPPPAELERLQRQHARLQRMKKEIWDEDRQLRGGV